MGSVRSPEKNMQRVVNLLSLPLLIITLAAGAFGAYEILTAYAGFSTVWGWGAAIAIDLTGLWLALFTTILKKAGAEIRSIQRSTYFVIGISVLLNAYHGWTIGSSFGEGDVMVLTGVVGALVGAIFPIFSAMIFHYNMTLITYEVDKQSGHYLTKAPTLPRGRYKNKTRHKELMERHAELQYDLQEYLIEQHRVSMGTDSGYKGTEFVPEKVQDETSRVQIEGTRVQAQGTQGTSEGYKGTEQGTYETLEVQAEGTRVQDETFLETQVESVLVGEVSPEDLYRIPDFLSPGMNTSEICRLLVEHLPGTNQARAFEIVNLLNEDQVSLNTVKQALTRAKKKAGTRQGTA